MKIIYLIILLYMHYFLSIKMFYKNEGKKSLFFYLKWVLGTFLLLIPTAVLAGIKPTEEMELIVRFVMMLMFISMSNLIFLLFKYMFSYGLNRTKQFYVSPERINEQLEQRQKILFTTLKALLLWGCAVMIIMSMFI